MTSVRATLHPDAPAALELSIARTRVLDYLQSSPIPEWVTYLDVGFYDCKADSHERLGVVLDLRRVLLRRSFN